MDLEEELATGLAVLGLCAHGAHIDNPSREPVHNALGDRPGTLFVDGEKLVQGQWYYWHFTAFPIGKQVDIDGNTIKAFMYLPAHGYAVSAQPSTNDGCIAAIGDGTNYMTGRGRIFENLREEYRSPSYDVSHPRSNAGDVTVWSTATAVPGSWIPQFAPLGWVASHFGDTAFAAGFSRLSTPATGLLTNTGDSYGYYARTSSGVPGDTQPGIYADLGYYTGNPLVAYNGRLNSSGSGSWVFNSQGLLIGAGVAFDGNYTATDGFSIFANFTAPEFYNQLAPYVGIQVVPGRYAELTGVAPDGADVLLTFRGLGHTNYVVQAASSLGTTNAFVDVSPAIVSTNGAAITNAFRHVGALTNAATRFYRLRLE